VAIVLFAALASSTQAGTYTMNQCGSASSRAVSVDWGLWNDLHGGSFFNSCAVAGGSFGIRNVEMDYNSVGGLTVTVPPSRPHVSIVHADAVVTTAPEQLDPSTCCNKQISTFRFSAGGQVLSEQEMTGWAEAISVDAPSTRDFQAGIYCTTANGPQNCSWTRDPTIGLSLFAFTLSESDPPSARATGGSLLSAGTLSGTQTLSYTASDADSGIRRVSIQLGDTTVATDDFGDRCGNDDWNACPTSQERVEMPIDTSQVPDGAYPLQLVVTDAASNTATVDAGRTVTVSNARANGPGAVPKTTDVQFGSGRAAERPFGRPTAARWSSPGRRSRRGARRSPASRSTSRRKSPNRARASARSEASRPTRPGPSHSVSRLGRTGRCGSVIRRRSRTACKRGDSRMSFSRSGPPPICRSATTSSPAVGE
jgi:hypothetical protein